MQNLLFVAALLAVSSACTDTTVAKYEALGSPHHIVCYSGGVVIFDGN